MWAHGQLTHTLLQSGTQKPYQWVSKAHPEQDLGVNNSGCQEEARDRITQYGAGKQAKGRPNTTGAGAGKTCLQGTSDQKEQSSSKDRGRLRGLVARMRAGSNMPKREIRTEF